jgi:hypothetical protein
MGFGASLPNICGIHRDLSGNVKLPVRVHPSCRVLDFEQKALRHGHFVGRDAPQLTSTIVRSPPDVIC